MSRNALSKPQGDAPEKLAKRDSYVAIGGSSIEGTMDLADPGNPDNFMFGWVDHLVWGLPRRRTAVSLTSLKYANLAIYGRKLPQMVTERMAIVPGIHPVLISTIGRGSDLVWVSRDSDYLPHLVESMVVSVRGTGVDVLLGTIRDSKGFPTIFLVRLTIAEFNVNVWSITQRHGYHMLDQWDLCPIHTMNLWVPDRLHLKPIGRRLMMNHMLQALGFEPRYPEYDQVFRDGGTTKWTFNQNREWVKSHLVP